MKPLQYILLAPLLLLLASGSALLAFSYEDPADYPLMGDWQGEWVNAKKGHEKAHPAIAAQLLPVNGGTHYRVVILPELYNRAEPYLIAEVPATDQRVAVDEGGYEVVFSGTEVRGRAKLHGDSTEFVLRKVALDSPTVGLQPPAGATVLFDGSDYSSWMHGEAKPVTWDIVGSAMQTVTKHDQANRAQGLGGNLQSREKFGSMRLHMEFRYPVEAGKSGQGRSNSGLFLGAIGEVQILNSYTTPNYWNECGAFYKRIPAKVDAAGPPLEWQAYDVDIDLQVNGKAVVTVQLNGRILHHQMEMPCGAKELSIGLQDHINILQFRNIWLVEK
jgi:hypothetical protein